MSDAEHRTPVTLSSVNANDPHMQPLAKNPGAVETYIAVLFLVGMLATIGFGVAYWMNWAPWALGATLGSGMLFIGIGLAAWGKYLMPRGPFVEERHEKRNSDEDREAFAATVVDRGGDVFKRRKVLGGLLAAGFGAFGVVAIFPLLRSLGPNPGNSLKTTNWRKGSYVVDSTGRRMKATDMAIGSIATVFPEGYAFDAEAQGQDQTVLIRISNTDFTTQRGRESWAPQGYVAYSKLCTHLGCPVGLYEQQLQLLVCPCHQSMFDVRNGAIPNFGPAPRPLPQLPLSIDAEGYIRSQKGYGEPVGPGFWERA